MEELDARIATRIGLTTSPKLDPSLRAAFSLQPQQTTRAYRMMQVKCDKVPPPGNRLYPESIFLRKLNPPARPGAVFNEIVRVAARETGRLRLDQEENDAGNCCDR